MEKDFSTIPMVNMTKHCKQIFGIISNKEIKYDDDGYEYLERRDEIEAYIRISILPERLRKEIEEFLNEKK